MVHVRSHDRQRQSAVAVTTRASVSITLPLQEGHAAGLATAPWTRDFPIVSRTNIWLLPFFLTS